ncbi:MAG TPA: type II secretion system protein, partial [Thermoanaerobaculia bacterium]|nr:type II secretion system protein [Thermoanaerobaculia bacterium]
MKNSERGMTLVETLVSLAIVAVVIAMSSTMISTALRTTQNNVNKQFATQKAMSMLEELRSLIQAQNGTTTVVIDDYDDGVTNQTVLTTQTGITDPAHPASGNTRIGSNWLFERRITVQRITGANDLRIVNVKVFIREGSSTRLLAEVAGVLSTIGQNMPPTQVYDVYLIAVENVPGWWLYMQNVVPFVESAMNDLESRHPGLQFRKHWIRKLSYGRDSLYKPYVNRNADSTQPIDSVYFYPGKLPDGSPVENYYPPDFFNAKVSIDGTVVNDDSPLSYALADQFNNAMRYPDELALFNQRVAAGLESADTPTLRLLLDDMVLRPALYRNAIVINLHGELFPFPPIRNYSDAAKDPGVYPYARVVTHPERLHSGNADGINLRVYSYHTNVANPGTVPDRLARPISVVLRGIQWLPGPGSITAITGGVD